MNPDIVQSWMYHANLAGTVVRGLGCFKPPLIWSIRQSLDNRSLDPVATRAVIWLGGKLSALPGAVVYNSVNAARTHEAIGYAAGRRRIIHNGIDCNRFRPRPELHNSLRVQLGLDPDTPLIGRIGRYSPMKGFDTLLKSFRKLLDVLPSAKLLLVGTGIGPDNQELMSLCSRYGCLEHVRMMKPRLDIEQVYPALDVVVSSSIGNEGFPNVVAEALASGGLVVSTSVGDGSPIDRGVHRIVSPQDDQALSKAMLSLATLLPEEKQRLSGCGRRFIENNFSIEAFAEQHIGLYEELSRASLADRQS
jgi:glycosyltransferase involved in cell wall biosynthesis